MSIRNIILLIVAIILVGAVFVSQKYPAKILEGDSNILGSSGVINDSEDSDSDGLKDWEEDLWKTDPNNPDTDSDGFYDGIEIVLKKDPTVAGPDDYYYNSTNLSDSSKKYLPEDDGTYTGKLSRDFFYDYVSKGGVYDPDTLVNEVSIEKLLEEYSNEIEAVRIKISDLNVFGEKDLEKIKKYGNEFFSIQKKRFSDLAVLLDTTKDPSHIPQVFGYIAYDYKNLSVPLEVANLHAEIIKNLQKKNLAILDVYDVEGDALKSLFGMRAYYQLDQESVDIYRQIAEYFIKNGIIFTNEEDGALWASFVE